MNLHSKLEKHLPREDSNGLLPCPFCGGEAKRFKRVKEFVVGCNNCCIHTLQLPRIEAVKCWNTRVETQNNVGAKNGLV